MSALFIGQKMQNKRHCPINHRQNRRLADREDKWGFYGAADPRGTGALLHVVPQSARLHGAHTRANWRRAGAGKGARCAPWPQAQAHGTPTKGSTCKTRRGGAPDRTQLPVGPRALLFGRDPSPRRALWPAAMRAAPTGRTHGRTNQRALQQENPCQRRAVHTWRKSGWSGPFGSDRYC